MSHESGATSADERSDAVAGLLERLRKEVIGGLMYTHSRANANTNRALETATFLFALVEVLAEKGVLTIEELDARKDQIADRVQRRFLEKGMGVVLQDPEQDKYAFAGEAHVDCENRVHLCKAACCRMLFPLSRQDIAERIVMWDLEAPYMIAQTEDRYCRHLDRATGIPAQRRDAWHRRQRARRQALPRRRRRVPGHRAV